MGPDEAKAHPSVLKYVRKVRLEVQLDLYRVPAASCRELRDISLSSRFHRLAPKHGR